MKTWNGMQMKTIQTNPIKNKGYVNYRIKIGEKPKKNKRPDINVTNILTNMKYDWTQPLPDGPQDIGYDYSYVSPQAIQCAPYVFFRYDGYLVTLFPNCQM